MNDKRRTTNLLVGPLLLMLSIFLIPDVVFSTLPAKQQWEPWRGWLTGG